MTGHLMTPPYWIVRNASVPAFFGRLVGRQFQAQTIGPFILIAGPIETRVLLHELRHVRDFYIGWAVGAVVWLLLSRDLLWLLLTPFTFAIAYVFAGFYAMARGGNGYRDNAFERAARKAAGEPE